MDPITLPDLQIPSNPAPQENQIPQTQEANPQPELTLGQGFLQGIPEQDRNIVAKYISDWDSQVTKKYQDIHSKYEPYKELGDPEVIKQALQINQAMQADPVAFYNQFAATLRELQEEGLLEMSDDFQDWGGNQTPPNTPPQGQQTPPVNDYAQLPQPAQEKFSQLEQMVQELSSSVQAQRQAAEDAANMRALDDLMANMHNEHGNFDDEWFLLQLQKGVSPEDAIKGWNNLVEGAINSRPRKAPPNIMGGAGTVPNGQVDPTTLNSEDRVKLIAGMLQQANG